MKTQNPYIIEFLEYCADERRLSINTIKAYRLDLKAFGKYLELKQLSAIENIQPEILREYASSIKSLKPRSVKRKIATIKSLFVYLAASGKLKNNQLESYRSNIRVGKTLPRIVSRKTVNSLLKNSYVNNRSTTLLSMT